MSVFRAYSQPVVVRVDFPVDASLAGVIAAYMAAEGEPMTVNRLRKHARDAYTGEGNMVDCDVEQWAQSHWSHSDGPSDADWMRSEMWLLTLGGAQ